MPTDQEYEKSLRDAVRAHYSNPVDEITVRSIRTKSEEKLGLETGFYKNDEVWKDKSKEIIQDQVDKCENGKDYDNNAKLEQRKSLKRASPATASRPRKKSKLDDDDQSTALSEPPESAPEENSTDDEEASSRKKNAMKKSTKKAAVTKPTKSAPRKKTKKDSSTSDLSDAPTTYTTSDAEEDIIPPSREEKEEADDTSSELSSVIDEPQPSRKSSKSKTVSTSKPNKSTSKSKSKGKPPAEADPKAEEIKRLQGWLVKCGIRKVWGKELKPFESQNAKISHLKSMLSDAGMSGRYSNEKAAQIKEARELAADLEAVQEGNELWGKDGEGDEAENQERGGRRLVRGAKNYAFLSSDGEEESD